MEKQAPNDKAAQMKLMHEAYEKMGKALKATGRPIVYSLLPVRVGRGVGVGARRWAATCGAPPATSRRNWNSMYTILSQQAGLAELRRAGALERSRHAGGGQRQA